MKNELKDFRIIQRNSEGFADVSFSGKCRAEAKQIIARVLREDDNSIVVPFTLCERNGEEWSVEFRLPEGGLYKAEAREFGGTWEPYSGYGEWGKYIKTVYHFGVGDVFIVAGQSNMAAYGRDAAYDPPQLGVHSFANSGKWEIAVHPLNSCIDTIYANSDDCSGTSPSLSFARTMHRRLGIPIGLLQAAQGGAPLYAFNPAQGENHILYDALMKKLDEVGDVAGVIWYQGCSETGKDEDAFAYLDNFTKMVKLWREKIGNVPFATVQLNRHTNPSTDVNVMRRWGIVREAQRQAAMTIKDVYCVSAIDMFTTDGIHNSSGCNVIIGERLAAAMLRGKYHMTAMPASPNVKRVIKKSDNQILVEFDEQTQGIAPMDNNAEHLNVQDSDGIMDCISAARASNGVLLTTERPIGENATFMAYWKPKMPAFFIRDTFGMPMLACYGVKIEE